LSRNRENIGKLKFLLFVKVSEFDAISTHVEVVDTYRLAKCEEDEKIRSKPKGRKTRGSLYARWHIPCHLVFSRRKWRKINNIYLIFEPGKYDPAIMPRNRKSLQDPSIDCLFVFYASFVVRFDRSLTSIGGMTTLLDAMRHSLVGAQE